LKSRYLVGRDKQLDRARLTWRSADQAEALQLHDHLMDAGRGDAEEALEVGLGRRLPIEQDVGVDEGQGTGPASR
jgi:hypothetical protein